MSESSFSMSGKMSIAAGEKAFYYMTRDSLCFLAMAEARYPKRLAFLYLDEIGDIVLSELVNEFGNQVRAYCTMLSQTIFSHLACFDESRIEQTMPKFPTHFSFPRSVHVSSGL